MDIANATFITAHFILLGCVYCRQSSIEVFGIPKAVDMMNSIATEAHHHSATTERSAKDKSARDV